MNNQEFLPVYLFTGFLDSGKTTFIQDTLADPKFNTGEKTLVIMCEEGETELNPSEFATTNVTLKIIEDFEDLTKSNLKAMLKESRAERVVVEYNGMWLLDQFYSAMPEDWAVYQEFCFVDANTIESYNANMRQLTFDKLQSCELCVFNRCPDDVDQQKLHELVRTASRRAEIIFEFQDGRIQYDEIEDPLPFDLEAPVVIVKDDDYAIWYRDMTEELSKYDNKDVMFTGRVLTKKTEKGSFIVGRHVMTCCADDIQFAALVAIADNSTIKSLTHNEWYTVTATINIRYHKCYGTKGPVLTVKEIRPAAEPEKEVATFF